nr:ABC transporter substrate-binding protein [Actinomycetota bacterium]
HSFADGDIGALVIEASVSVLASTDQPEDAQRFVEYLLTDEAQRYFASETFEYPLVDGIEPATDLPPLPSLDPPEVDVDALGPTFADTVELIDRSGIDG